MAKKKQIMKSKSELSYEEKKELAEITLRKNNYSEAEIEKIIKLSFGDPPA